MACRKTSVVPPDDYVEAPTCDPHRRARGAPAAGHLAGSAAGDGCATAPRIGIDLPVLEGDGYRVPEDAAAHFPEHCLARRGLEYLFYGHAREGLFLELWHMRTGDLVEMTMADGTIEYPSEEILPVVAVGCAGVPGADRCRDADAPDLPLLRGHSARFVVIAERIPAS